MQCVVRYSRVEEMGKNGIGEILVLGERGNERMSFYERLLGFARSSF